MYLDDDFLRKTRTNGCCACCDEFVGSHDCNAILNQIKMDEKTCMWCGENFPLDDDGSILVESIEKLAEALNRQTATDRYCSAKESLSDAIPSFEKVRKSLGLVHRIIEKEDVSDPMLADEKGNPRDRMLDAISYEEIIRDSLLHKILIHINAVGSCSSAEVYRKVPHSKVTKRRPIRDLPLSRLVASDLLKCESKFICFRKAKEESYSYTPRDDFVFFEIDKIPVFGRTYTITPKGKDIVETFEKTKKGMVFV